ncbi:MAG: SGNH/GDSL hydrolase family protein [Ruminococcus sp.]|nr:SGNH/GDSL hydrolase family protein [Ruminococcus sp.]
MFEKLKLTIVSAIILCSLTGCSLVKQDIVEKECNIEVPAHMVFLGDSIAAGYGLDGYTSDDNYNCDSYSNLLANQYKQELAEICIPEMQNFSVSGATSDDLLSLLDSGKIDSALEKADVVVISIGGNDMLHEMYGLLAELGMSEENPKFDFNNVNIISALSKLITLEDDVNEALEKFELNICEISDKINSKSSGELYVQTLYNPLESLTQFQILVDFSNDKIDRYNQIVRENAQNYKIIDVEEQFKGKTDELTRIKKMDIHPNVKGHKLIAEIVDASFRETGFTYKTQEYSKPYLPLSTIMLIIGGICVMLAVVLIVIPKLFSKHENSEIKTP